MKKLLSAVTSLVTAATFVSSAFTSSIVVSAAGSVPAVQPNVSMGGVKDIAANKNASSKSPITADADITFDFTNPESEDGYWRVDPEYGDCLVQIRMTSKSNVQNITSVTLNLLVEGGFDGEIYAPCEALGENLSTNDAVFGLTVICQKSDGHGTGINPDNNLLAQMAFIVPDGTPDGLYQISVNPEDADNAITLDQGKDMPALFVPMNVIPGYIAVGDVTPSGSSTTTTKATTTSKATTTTTTKDTDKPASTTTKQTTTAKTEASTTTTTTTKAPTPAPGTASWVIPEVHAKKGETAKVDIVVSGDSDLAVAGAQFNLNASDSLGQPKVTGGNAYNASDSLVSNKNEYAFGRSKGDGKTAKNNDIILTLEYTIPENITAGRYPITWSDLFVSDTNGLLDITDSISTVDGAIIIDESYDGEIAWDIEEVTAKPGETVEMKVLVIDEGDSKIPVAGAQFNINADTAEFVSVDGSAAYDSKIVNNKERNEFAFGHGIGKGVAADNNATVMTLKYTAPTKPGVYPVDWSEAFISDTNGQDITDKISLLPGSITVAEQGEITWDIDDVTAKPGEEVFVDVLVIDEAGSALPVAGAQFNINADTAEFISVDGSAAYDSKIVNNKERNEFAFGHGIGKGVAAANNAKVMTLKYKAPTKPGVYPIEWSEEFVSDTYGLDITDQITFLPGSITVAPQGEITWDIEDVTAKPGEKVSVDVLVIDEAGSALPVAGAQFKITADTAEFVSVDGSTAYDSKIVNNKERNEFAFGHGIGKGVAAANNAKVMTLTYTAPTKPGVYPIEWSEEFISDTYGLDITDQITFLPGSITVEEQGEITWVIPEVYAKPGETVTMKVYVDDAKNSKLPVAGAQFAIDADPALVYNNSSVTSEAYNAGIVENAKTNEYAFANSKGAGVAADDKATVFELTFTVPENPDKERYPVNWVDNAFISDENGLDITDNVTLRNGAIIITEESTTTTTESTTTTKAPTTTTTTAAASSTTKATTSESTTTTPKATTTTTTSAPATSTTTTTTVVTPVSGGIIWEIATTHAKPGDTVTLTMAVKDPDGAKLPVGGAQFNVKVDAPIGYDKAEGTPYSNVLVANDKTNEYAFANSTGKGIVAEDGEVMITFTYTVPEDCASGEYKVNISDLFVSDENGFDITANVTPVNGLIIVDPDITTSTTSEPVTTTSTTSAPATSTSTSTSTTSTTVTTTTTTIASGNIMWVVGTDTVNPGETATVQVVVSDPQDVKLAISGAQFIVDSADGITYSGATGSEGYGAEIETNGKEVAFAHGIGKAVAASDGATVITLTFEVPEDCAAGEYPVTLTELFASDGNGSLDITKNITVVPGAVIVNAKSTSTTSNTTTTSTTTVTSKATTTTTTSAPATSTTTTTTVVTPVSGGIIWEIATTHAKPGDTVTLTMAVKDPDGSKLPVGGAQFTVKVDAPIGYDKAEGTPYSNTLVANDKTNEYAFANSTGKGIVAEDGEVMITFTYTVPEDCASGEYKVNISDLFVSDENGFDITANVTPVNGLIIVDPDTTTSTSEPATTTSTSEPATSTSTSEPATSTSTSEPATSTSTSEPTTSTSTSEPTTSTSTSEPATSTSTSEPTTSTSTSEPATSTSTSTSSEPATSTSGTTVSTTIGGSIEGSGATRTQTTTNGTALPGSGTHTVTSTTYPFHYVTFDTQPGFYFSHDDGTTHSDGSQGGFKMEQIYNIQYFRVAEVGAQAEEVKDTDDDRFDPSLLNFGTQTPENVFDPNNKTFKFDVYVYYGDDYLYQMIDGVLTPVTVTAYIGVKGDVNFNGRADAVDASVVSIYYAMLSTMNDKGEYRDPYEVILSTPDNDLITVDSPDNIYDEFAAFLGDVDTNEWAEDNWKVKKDGRKINAVDASGISHYYALVSINDYPILPTEQEAWDIASPYRFDDIQYTQKTIDKFLEVGIK